MGDPVGMRRTDTIENDSLAPSEDTLAGGPTRVWTRIVGQALAEMGVDEPSAQFLAPVAFAIYELSQPVSRNRPGFGRRR